MKKGNQMKTMNTFALLSMLALASCGGSGGGGSTGSNNPLAAAGFSEVSQCATPKSLTSTGTMVVSKAIYGEDDREDVCSSRVGKREYELAKSTAMFIESSKLKEVGSVNGKKVFKLESETLEESFGAPACSNVSFPKEKAPGFCTGFLYKSDVENGKSLLTAGHCLWDTNDSDVKVVFTINANGTKVVSNNPANANEIYVSEDQVYSITNSTYEGGESRDFSKVTLDRNVPNTNPVEVDMTYDPTVDDKIQMVGHPYGIALKFTEGRVSHSRTSAQNFGAHISSFGGNSGSPVVSKESGKVVGILVSGQSDYEYDYMNDCVEQTTFTTSDSGSEGVFRIGEYLY
jgi:V8-like Glu-specific endopeptidase